MRSQPRATSAQNKRTMTLTPVNTPSATSTQASVRPMASGGRRSMSHAMANTCTMEPVAAATRSNACLKRTEPRTWLRKYGCLPRAAAVHSGGSSVPAHGHLRLGSCCSDSSWAVMGRDSPGRKRAIRRAAGIKTSASARVTDSCRNIQMKRRVMKWHRPSFLLYRNSERSRLAISRMSTTGVSTAETSAVRVGSAAASAGRSRSAVAARVFFPMILDETSRVSVESCDVVGIFFANV